MAAEVVKITPTTVENDVTAAVTKGVVNPLSGMPLLGIVIAATFCGLVLIMLIVLTFLLLLRRSGCMRRGKLKSLNVINSKPANNNTLTVQGPSISELELEKLSKTPQPQHHHQNGAGDNRDRKEDQVPLMLNDLPSPPDANDKSLGESYNRNSWIGRDTSFRLNNEEKVKVLEKLRKPNGQTIVEQGDTPVKQESTLPPVRQGSTLPSAQEESTFPPVRQESTLPPARQKFNLPPKPKRLSLDKQDSSMVEPARPILSPSGRNSRISDSTSSPSGLSSTSTPTSVIFRPTLISIAAGRSTSNSGVEPLPISHFEHEPKPARSPVSKPVREMEPNPPRSPEPKLVRHNDVTTADNSVAKPRRDANNLQPTTSSPVYESYRAVPAVTSDVDLAPASSAKRDQVSSPETSGRVGLNRISSPTSPTVRPNKLKIPPPTLPKPKINPKTARRSSNNDSVIYDVPRVHSVMAGRVAASPVGTDNYRATPGISRQSFSNNRGSAASTPVQSPSVAPWERSSARVAPWDRHTPSPSRTAKPMFTEDPSIKRSAQKTMPLQNYTQLNSPSRQPSGSRSGSLRVAISEDSPSPLYHQQMPGQPRKVATVKPNSSVKHSSYQSFREHLHSQYGPTAPSQGQVKVTPPTVDGIEDEKLRAIKSEEEKTETT